MLNKRLLTVEDANSIIKHFSKGFVDYYVLDTRVLTTVDTWFAYDFIDIYRVSGSISFTVRNSLWTGGFRVIDCNVSSPTVSVSNGTITVSKTGLEWVVLELELSPEFSNDSIFELDYEVEYTPCIRPFYEDVALTMGFLDGETAVSGMTVTDITSGGTETTDSDGLVTVTSGINKKGDYDYILETENNGVTVDYRFPYQRIPVEFPIILLNEHIYRDKVNTLQFQFLYDALYSLTEAMLFSGNHIRLRVDGVYYELKSYTSDTFTFDVPIGMTANTTLVLSIGGNDYIDNYTVEIPVETSFVTVSTASALITELNSNNPASKIVFTGDTLDTVVSVNDDVSIQFTDDVESNLDTVFTVNTGAVLTLEDISFTGKNLVNLNNGECILVNCSLQHCTSTIIKGTGGLSVTGSSFIDNVTCIDVNGDVDCVNVLFDLSDSTYLDTGSPAFIRVSDTLLIDYCQFNLDLTGLTSLGLSYVMLFLGKNCLVNSMPVSNLFQNGTFPVNHNTGTVNVESTNYRFTSIGNKCVVWSIADTNTVYYNNLNVEYIGGE